MKDIKKSASLKSKVKGKETPFNIDLNYSEQYDSFIVKVKKGEGILSYTDSLQGLPLEVVQKLNQMLEEVLIKAGSKTEMKEHKMYDGGDFQAGVYAMGGSLESHGIKEGDTFLKTMSGAIQKVKDKSGNIVYVNLANGERSSQRPLPFDNGGKLGEKEVSYFINKDGIRVRSQANPKQKLSEKEWMSKHSQSKEARSYYNGGDLFEDYQNQPKELAKIVDFYMEKINDGDFDYVDSRKFLREVNAIGYTFDYGLDNVPYNLRPISSKYALGGLFGKAKETLRPVKHPNLEGKQVSLKNGKMVQVFEQNGSQLSVLELGRIGTGERPRLINISEVDMTSFKNGGSVTNERKHVNHNEDYEVRYAKPRPNRTGYKGKRRFDEGGEVSFIDYNGTEIMFEPNYKKYYVKDVEFDTLEEAIRFIKNEEVDSRIRDAYSRGLFNDGGGIEKKYVYKTNNKTFADDLLKYADLQGIKASNKKIGSYFYITTNRKILERESMPKELKNIVNFKMGTGGGISTAERFKKVVAKNQEANRVKPKSQKSESGSQVKKGNRGGVMVLAKKIRKEGESWKDALKRAGQQLK